MVHYLWPREFIIHYDHQSLKFLKTHKTLNKIYVKRLEFINIFPYVIKYKHENENVMVDALFRKYALLITWV